MWRFALQVLPFLLRRNKEDVLQDLPPKITQDYYCDLSPLQRILYEDFKTRHSATLISGTSGSSSGPQSSHVFEALRYLRNVCNHPKLVLKERHPLYQTVCIRYIRFLLSNKEFFKTFLQLFKDLDTLLIFYGKKKAKCKT